MGEGNKVRPRGRRGREDDVIPEEGGDLGDLTMKQIKDARLKERTALEQKERERTVPAIVDKPAVTTKEDVIEIPFTKSMRKNLFDLGWSKEEIEKNLELMSSKLGDIIEPYDERKFREALAFFEAQLKRKENTRPIAVKNIEMTREIVSDLKNYIKKKATTSETPTPEVTPAANAEDKKVETLSELRETITNARLELKYVEKELAEIKAKNLPETASFPKSFIEDKISKMLQAFDKVTKVISVEAGGVKNKISLALRILAEEDEIGIKADIENIGGAFVAKNLKIEAGIVTKAYLKLKIKPKLDQIEELLKGEVEKEKGKKVEKIWIENGELRVKFQKGVAEEPIIKREKKLLLQQVEIKKVLDENMEAEKRLSEPETPVSVAEPIVSAPVEATPTPKITEKEVLDFIDEFNLGLLLPKEFETLNELQKLKVIRDLKRRIVDLVKSDAQTQYSGDLKERTKIAQIRASINKELEMKNFEAKAFVAIRDTDEGKKLIADNLTQLTEITKEREIFINNGKPEIVFINPDDGMDATEKATIATFNTAANNFREMPYEWGQEVKRGSKWNPEIVKGHRTKYEQVKKEYEKARNAILIIEGRKKGEKAALTDMLQLDNIVQLDQLINTHPEFEAELSRLSKSGGLGKQGKDVWNMAGGKGGTNKLIFAGGFTARTLVKGTALLSNTSIVTWLAASSIGAIVGGVRGYFKGKETLTERQQQARYGQEDTSKERVVTTDVTHLNKRLEDLLSQIDNSKTDEEKAKRLSMLEARIEHTRGKIEKGQVNFGDTKSALINQFNLVNNLNKALVLQKTMSGKNNEELKTRIDALLATQGKNIAEKTSEAQSAFVKKQMWKGAAIGAGAATAGYVVRWFGEQMGGWWSHHVSEVTNTNSDITLKTLHGANIKLHETVSSHASTNIPKLATAHGAISSSAQENLGINQDAIVHKGQGIEHAFIRQIEHNHQLAKDLGFTGNENDPHALHAFAQREAHVIAIKEGYVDNAGHEVRITEANKVAFEIKTENGHPVVVEKTMDGKVLGTFDEKEGYEFGKNPDNQFEKEIKVDITHHGPVAHDIPVAEATTSIPVTETPTSPVETHVNDIEKIRAKLHEQYDPNASWRTDTTRPLKELHEAHTEPRSPRDWGQRSTGTYQHDLLNRHPEFANNPFHLSGTKLIAYEASQKDINFLFGEKPFYLMHVRASDIINADLANSDPEPALMARCLHQLEFFSRLKPKGSSWFGIGKAETTEEYITRAFQKLVKNGGLRLFEEIKKNIK